jgi:peptidyl-prolyl cis-trans isomerase B (cyclophilin B)
MTTPTTPAPGATTNVLAIISLIAAFVIAPLGIILGFIAQNQIKTTGEGGAGLAKAGIILGIVFTVLGLIGIILSFVLPFLILGSYGYTY